MLHVSIGQFLIINAKMGGGDFLVRTTRSVSRWAYSAIFLYLA